MNLLIFINFDIKPKQFIPIINLKISTRFYITITARIGFNMNLIAKNLKVMSFMKYQLKNILRLFYRI
jgi:hypothetical protein